MVQNRVGSSLGIVNSSIDYCLSGPVTRLRPWLESCLSYLRTRSELPERVSEISHLVVRNFSSARTSVRSAPFELQLNDSRIDLINKLRRDADVLSNFKSAKAANVLDSEIDTLICLVVDDVNRAMVERIRQSFAPGASFRLVIPTFDVREPLYNSLVQQTLYYISGYLLSSLYSKFRRGSPVGVHLDVFVACHSITAEMAKKDSLPIGFVETRTKGSLIFSSRSIYELVLHFEHACSSLLTTKNLIAQGGSLVAKVMDRISESGEISSAFAECMKPILGSYAKEHITAADSALIFQMVLITFIKMRGKDLVKSIVSKLKLKQAAAGANSHRSKLAVLATTAAKNALKKAKVSSESKSNRNDVHAEISPIDDFDIDEDTFDAIDFEIDGVIRDEDELLMPELLFEDELSDPLLARYLDGDEDVCRGGLESSAGADTSSSSSSSGAAAGCGGARGGN